MRVLALDFDGVICSSSHEVFVVGLRTYAQLKPDSPLVSGHPALSSPGGTLPDLAHDSLYRSFEELVPLGNRAEDFGIALKSLEARVPLPDQRAYDRFYAQQESSWLERFHAGFYEQRSVLREQSTGEWIGLHRPFPELTELLIRHARSTRMAIATAKDRQSVRILLEEFGISGLFPDHLVMDKETGVDKTAHLRALSSRLEIHPAQITFIDDKVKHLITVAPLGVRPILAGWGHNTAREHELATAMGFSIATLEEAEEVLFC